MDPEPGIVGPFGRPCDFAECLFFKFQVGLQVTVGGLDGFVQARGQSQRIKSLYQAYGVTEVHAERILSHIAKSKHLPSPQKAAEALGLDYRLVIKMNYQIGWIEGEGNTVKFLNSDERISADRDCALLFSKDLAGGLLTILQHDLLQRREEDSSALSILSETSASLENRKP